MDQVTEIKRAMTPEKLCTGDAKQLLPFAREIFNIEFTETPNYNKLKFMLVSLLLAHDMIPSLKFDWSKF